MVQNVESQSFSGEWAQESRLPQDLCRQREKNVSPPSTLQDLVHFSYEIQNRYIYEAPMRLSILGAMRLKMPTVSKVPCRAWILIPILLDQVELSLSLLIKYGRSDSQRFLELGREGYGICSSHSLGSCFIEEAGCQGVRTGRQPCDKPCARRNLCQDPAGRPALSPTATQVSRPSAHPQPRQGVSHCRVSNTLTLP